MTTNNSIKKNVIMNGLLTISTIIFPIITFPYVSRVLSPSGTGRVSFATSLISYFNMFAHMGIPTYGIRACAKVRDDRIQLTKTAHELLFINIIFTFISYLFLVIALLYVPRLYEDRFLYTIVSLNIFLSGIGMEWLYKALEQYSYITIRSIIFKFLALIMMFSLVHKQDDYVIYGGITIFASSASNILNFINIHKYIDVKWIGSYNFKRHLKPVAIFFAMACATTIYTHMDTVMLGFMATDVDVGYYNAAIKIKQILVSIVTSLGAVLLPRSSYFIEQGHKDKFERMSIKALNYVFIVAIPMVFYFILFAKQGVYFLSGAAYEGAIVPMRIIMPTLLFIGLTNIFGIQMLVPLGKEFIVLLSEIIGAIVNLVVNALLIPKFLSAGAAIGTCIAEFAVLIVQFNALKDTIKPAVQKISFWKFAISIIFSVTISFWVPNLGMSPFITLIISAFLFFGIYLLVLLILKEKLIYELLNQTKNFVREKLGRR